MNFSYFLYICCCVILNAVAAYLECLHETTIKEQFFDLSIILEDTTENVFKFIIPVP